jgi:hypothetical protein
LSTPAPFVFSVLKRFEKIFLHFGARVQTEKPAVSYGKDCQVLRRLCKCYKGLFEFDHGHTAVSFTVLTEAEG